MNKANYERILSGLISNKKTEIEALQSLFEERDQLQAFKDFVHRRLDEMGIPTHPDGEHSKAGCRIGDRLEIIAGKLYNA